MILHQHSKLSRIREPTLTKLLPADQNAASLMRAAGVLSQANPGSCSGRASENSPD